MKPYSIKLTLKLAKWTWISLIFAGLIWFVTSQDWTQIFRGRGFLTSILSVMCVMIAHSGVVLSQGEAIAACGTRISWKDNLRIFNLANISKYIPVGGANLAVYAVLIKRSGISSKNAGAALTLTILWTISGAFIFGVPSVAYILGLPVLPITIFTLVTWLIGMKVRTERVFNFRGNYKPETTVIGQTMIWLGYGIAFSLILHGQIKDVTDFIRVGSAYNFSFGVGYLAVFAPSGIGVREVITTFVLPDREPSEIIAATLYLRILIFTADLIFGGIATTLGPDNKSKQALSTKI